MVRPCNITDLLCDITTGQEGLTIFANVFRNHLICAIHPTGVSDEDSSCPDFSSVPKNSIKTLSRYKVEDFEFAEALIRNASYRNQQEANQFLATLLAEKMYEPVEEVLKHPLSDFFYYVLRLPQRLTVPRLIENPDEYCQQVLVDKYSILVHQAKFLISHGSSQVLTPENRQFLYGQDDYIARRISNYLQYRDGYIDRYHQSNLDELLQRISANANLHGFDALARLRGSEYLFGYEYSLDFDIDAWERDWENTDKYLPVPFSVARTLAFVKNRFDIALDYPFV